MLPVPFELSLTDDDTTVMLEVVVVVTAVLPDELEFVCALEVELLVEFEEEASVVVEVVGERLVVETEETSVELEMFDEFVRAVIDDEDWLVE